LLLAAPLAEGAVFILKNFFQAAFLGPICGFLEEGQ